MNVKLALKSLGISSALICGGYLCWTGMIRFLQWMASILPNNQVDTILSIIIMGVVILFIAFVIYMSSSEIE